MHSAAGLLSTHQQIAGTPHRVLPVLHTNFPSSLGCCAAAVYRCRYIHLGSLAYIGSNRAVMQLPTALPVSSLKGWVAAHVWRALELYMQVGGGDGLL